MKVKVMEAIALGVPVVTTPDGAEGLPPSVTTHISVGDDNNACIDAVCSVLADKCAAATTAEAAREALESELNPKAACERFVSVTDDCLFMAGSR